MTGLGHEASHTSAAVLEESFMFMVAKIMVFKRRERFLVLFILVFSSASVNSSLVVFQA